MLAQQKKRADQSRNKSEHQGSSDAADQRPVIPARASHLINQSEGGHREEPNPPNSGIPQEPNCQNARRKHREPIQEKRNDLRGRVIYSNREGAGKGDRERDHSPKATHADDRFRPSSQPC